MVTHDNDNPPPEPTLADLAGAWDQPFSENEPAESASASEVVNPFGDYTAAAETAGTWKRLDDFMRQVSPAYDWLIPGVLERGERLILTGGEGHGKSVLLRQWAVMAASGVSWFGMLPMPKLHVALLDLENSERQVRRELDKMDTSQASQTLMLRCYPEGLDIQDRNSPDVERLAKMVAGNKIDILFAGPLYKLVGGDPIKEEPARAATWALDTIRAQGCAVVLEAHNAKASDDKRKFRPREPYGASLWLRWPEYGLHLGPEGHLTHWRGSRGDGQFPAKLERGKAWPWTPDNSCKPGLGDPDHADKKRIYDAVAAADGKLSGREVKLRAGFGPTAPRGDELIAKLVSDGFIHREKHGSAYLHSVGKPWGSAPWDGAAGAPGNVSGDAPEAETQA